MDSVLAFSPASPPLELGVLLWEAACVGENNPPKLCRAWGEDGIKRASPYMLDSGTVFQVIAVVRVVFKITKVSCPICLRVFDRKRLIVIAVLSVLISWVKPSSGHASVHVVKAIYEQWPDMKPRLLRSCKQPHLFEPTCSPVFTGPVNNEISPAYYYYNAYEILQ